MGGCGDGGSNGGGEKELINAVLTCEGNISDPDLTLKLSRLTHHLQEITYSDSNWLVAKVEPWNSVRVTFSIPKEAAIRLHQLAQAGDTALRQLGILSVQVDGDQIVSLKVVGPNNEATEIVLRPEGVAGPSGESSGNSSVAQAVTQALGATSLLPGFSQQHHQPHPTPQFRSPSLNNISTVGRAPVVRPPINQGYTNSGPNSPIISRHSVAPTVVPKPVYPSNPPPPYPLGQEVIRQTIPTNGPPFPNSSVSNASQQVNSSVQVTSNYRTIGSHMSAASSVPPRPPIRTPVVNMVKNSPLLVGLLQQPEQSSTSIAGVRKSLPPSPSLPLENGPLPSTSSTIGPTSTASTYVGRSRDGLTTHQQIFSGGSIITNSLPPPPQRHLIPSGFPLKTQEEVRKCVTPISKQDSSSSTPAAATSPHLNKLTLDSLADRSPTVPPPTTSSSSNSNHKKENQYLINPNTGLLEPRPATDSSDSETEVGRIGSPVRDERMSTSVGSDEDSNVSVTSRKETDFTESDISRVSSSASCSIETHKIPCPPLPPLLGNSRDNNSKDSSLVLSSWENNVVTSSSPGEKIKLRLKLGKEQMAQATIVGSAKQRSERRDDSVPGGNNSPTEPRVPKLHIKFHSSQPVIIKPIDETTDQASSRSKKESEKSSKRKSNRKFKNSDAVDLEPFRSKSAKLKSVKEKQLAEELGSKRSHKYDSDVGNSLLMKIKDDSRLKISRLCDKPKIDRLSEKSKLDSKMRTRLKKPAMRKVGDLNSMGELATYKILETLPPSITKVAALHTQQPHCNPSSSPSIPLSSLTPSLFVSGGSSVTSSSTTTTTTTSSSDQLKAQLVKRGSEIIPKPEVKLEETDILMTKHSSQPIKSLRVLPQSIKGLMNGDVSHAEKMRFKGKMPQDFSASCSKLTIKRKGTDEMHILEALKKEGLGNVPKFLNSSVLINKVSSDKSVVSNLVGSLRHTDDFCDKFLNKVDGLKSPLRGSDIAGLKSNSDITIHSVSKSEILGLDRRPELTIKPKVDITAKVGRVTCVDVMDRKALEEALKSSRISSKKNDVTMTKSTSSMVDRLRRWNSIDSSNRNPLLDSSSSSSRNSLDSSNPVPFSSHSHPPTEESTNLYSVRMKAEAEELPLGLSSKKTNTVNNVNKPVCDSSSKDFGITKDDIQKEPQKTADECDQPPIKKEMGKISDLINPASVTKVDVDSPEGTPKGEHGNGQGGEDSGIESMDALSEKSPNHSDQSPNRRDEKDCEMFPNNTKVNDHKENKHEESSAQTFTEESSSKIDSSSYSTKEVESGFNNEKDDIIRQPAITSTDVNAASSDCEEKISSSKHSIVSETDINIGEEGLPSLPTEILSENLILERLLKGNGEDCQDATEQNSIDKATKLQDNSIQKSVDNSNYLQTGSMLQDSWPSSRQEDSEVNSMNIISSGDIVNADVINMNDADVDSSSLGISMSITTTSISTSSPRSSLVSSPSVSSSNLDQQESFESSFPLPNLRSSSASTKLSVLAISLSKSTDGSATPPLMEAISSSSCATSTSSSSSVSCSSSPSSVDGQNDSPSPAFCPSLASSCNNNSLSYLNSYSSSATNTTMIVRTTAPSNTTCESTPLSTNKSVALKPSICQAAPVGKTFRLVALPSISNQAMNQSTNPVKGQLVTLKPVTSKGTSLLQMCYNSEEPMKTTVLSPVDRPPSSGEKTDDLDFVGFSKEEKSSHPECEFTLKDEKSSTEEEPTPLRVHPPLYTYGNRERKKEVESDAEDGSKEPSTKMDALTIEIPNEADDKRLTRSTRHSARLASPKVNSELSPKRQAGPAASMVVVAPMGKPSPVLRSSTSPALRVTKRRRHESESSNASTLSEDLQEPPSKVFRRKTTQDSIKDALIKAKTKENEIDKGETSDDESLAEEDSCKMRNPSSSTNEDEDETSRSSKAITRTKHRIRDTTPTRRTQRQTTRSATAVNNSSASSSTSNSNSSISSNRSTTEPTKQQPQPATLSSSDDKKVKREIDSEQARRQTRSTVNSAAAPEDANKRRRLSKETPK